MPVHVTLGEKGGIYLFTVKDMGKGIDKKDLPYIFEGHHKGEGGEEGMGIGLFFVESVVRQHKATINVKSKLKRGTTVEIRLPKSKI
jgi:signal transduction histidine kinase